MARHDLTYNSCLFEIPLGVILVDKGAKVRQGLDVLLLPCIHNVLLFGTVLGWIFWRFYTLVSTSVSHYEKIQEKFHLLGRRTFLCAAAAPPRELRAPATPHISILIM